MPIWILKVRPSPDIIIDLASHIQSERSFIFVHVKDMYFIKLMYDSMSTLTKPRGQHNLFNILVRYLHDINLLFSCHFPRSFMFYLSLHKGELACEGE